MKLPLRNVLTCGAASAFRRGGLVLLSLIVFLTFFQRITTAEERSGEHIYQELCASCHGDQGQGTDEYSSALAGDRPLAELIDLVTLTMPADDPEACVGEDAEKVAAYVYERFYSEAAQAAAEEARVELSRLTVRQYMNAVADLVGSFSPQAKWDDDRGLEGEYYEDKRFRDSKRELERRDAVINFDFGKSSPLEEKIDAKEFSIQWEGSVLAPDTGEYEFIVHTENAFRLYINDDDEPLIDAWVKSGDQTEYRETINLLGGRAYPIRLEWFKAEKDSSNTDGTASVRLHWKPPHQAEHLIPERLLSPHETSTTLVIETPFPPDDRSVGYERGASVSKAWDEATTYAAIEVAAHVAKNLEPLAGYDDDGDENKREQKIREFCRIFAERAFRRPLTKDEQQFYIDQHFEGTGTPDAAVKRVVLLVLKSPRFLYREITTDGLDPYEVASRISFGLWDSLPDTELLEAAKADKLKSPEQIAEQVERMVDDLRTRSKLREFLHQWLRVDHIGDISKDESLYPQFSEEVTSDLRSSLDLFLDEVVWSEQSDFRELLLADYLYVNGKLAEIYEVDLPPDAAFQRVSADPEKRAGGVSHPLLLTGFAYHSTSSPIHRGVFIARSLLGRSLKPPPEAVSPLSPDLHAGLTTRERVDLQTSPAACQTCHGLINPLGFSLENYDALGRYRTEEKDRPIDASGFYRTMAGEKAEFTGVRELATFLAASPEVHRAFVEQLFHHFVKQNINAYGPDQSEKLRQSFLEKDFNIQKLLVDVLTASALSTS